MNERNAIEVVDVYKSFKKYADKSSYLKDKIIDRKRKKYTEHTVLNGISFEIKKGEAVGFVGCNGCGKSTTLKLLSRIMYPDSGRIELRGRVSSLLELGAGFHPDLNGLENIYMNASVFGLKKKEIDSKLEEIIRFSELGEAIYDPIRTYSSGMYMKLAFSVAINVNADILLIDEILGVGDVSYQKKCFEKLKEIKQNEITIVIVSHSTDQIENICDRSIWLEEGKIKMSGDPKQVHKEYLEIMEDKRLQRKEREALELAEKERLLEKRKKNFNKEKEEVLAEIEKRRKEREELQKKATVVEIDKQELLELQKKGIEEVERQEQLLKAAEEERKKQLEIHNSIDFDKVPEERKGILFHKRNADRLEVVVKEKNIEIERLNSVIEQRTIAEKKLDIQLKSEIARLEQVVSEKEEEIDRLNIVIIEKDNEIERINLVVKEKDLEIEKRDLEVYDDME